MKIAHFSDLHYSPERLAEADRCFAFAVDDAVRREACVAVISGDSTDHRLDAHSPALNALARRIHRLAEDMPVLMLQGTFSHEPPGTLSNFSLMGESYHVFIADRVQQVALVDDRFFASEGPVFSPPELEQVRDMRPSVVFTCLPTVNKGSLAASVGAVAAGTELGDVLATYLAAAGRVNLELRAAGIATVGVSHGTVNGCSTEHGVTMAGFDHEFSLGALFDAQCSAFMLGHIHKHQHWEREGRRIAYPGSIGRFHYGEEGDKGYLMWDVQTDVADSVLVPTPSRQMISIEFDGPPDMDRLAVLAADAHDKFVRVRWQVDEEHRQLVDRGAIDAMFALAGGLKLEGRVLPVVRSRAQGISLESTVQGKVARWCELVNVEAEAVVERLQLLDSGDAEAIAAAVLSRIDLASDTRSLALAVAGDVSADQPSMPEPAASVSVDAPTASPSLSWLTDDLFAA
ncbi:metallophosphatase family protein [Paraburkholderia sp. SARCC-3016]|uniref:metallophosphoesterase family protein n=1 Tax=Paraburkholderia sp. SARCC-3016 TaxID=3058611 RepID=UPI0028077BAD|nr:metallophosphatase family protein [Paraburkholderia sp. SARCC-3016]MDQ7980297.1 metallophosphatase family protein [Paraburkholderia sp. SARCC-3016]